MTRPTENQLAEALERVIASAGMDACLVMPDVQVIRVSTIRNALSAYRSAQQAEAGAAVVGRSLLRAPIKHISECGPCHCPPDRCGAPVIMGMQTPCLRNAPKPPEPETPEAAFERGRQQGMEQARALREPMDRDVAAACSELRDALGNPVISGAGEQTLHGQIIRAATARLSQPAASSAQEPAVVACPQCGCMGCGRCGGVGVIAAHARLAGAALLTEARADRIIAALDSNDGGHAEVAAFVRSLAGAAQGEAAAQEYLQGHVDGLEWAAQMVEADDPRTSDWLYDDRNDLAAAIRRGPELPPAAAVAQAQVERKPTLSQSDVFFLIGIAHTYQTDSQHDNPWALMDLAARIGEAIGSPDIARRCIELRDEIPTASTASDEGSV